MTPYGHFRRYKTYERLQALVYWPKRSHNVKDHVQCCQICQFYKPETLKTAKTVGTGNSAHSQLSHCVLQSVLFTFGAFLFMFARYNLACHRLETLLQNIDLPPLNSANNAQYFLRKPDKVVEEDQRVFSAYQDCIQLQLQLNLAHHAVQRLRVSLGASRKSLPTANSLEAQELVHNSSTEQLRTIIRYLLDTLLSLLHSNNGE